MKALSILILGSLLITACSQDEQQSGAPKQDLPSALKAEDENKAFEEAAQIPTPSLPSVKAHREDKPLDLSLPKRELVHTPLPLNNNDQAMKALLRKSFDEQGEEEDEAFKISASPSFQMGDKALSLPTIDGATVDIEVKFN